MAEECSKDFTYVYVIGCLEEYGNNFFSQANIMKEVWLKEKKNDLISYCLLVTLTDTFVCFL